VLTSFLAICLAYLAVLAGVALVSLLSWLRARRAAVPRKHHRWDPTPHARPRDAR